MVNPLFIIGYGRSGTTLIWHLLNRHPEVCLQSENHLIFNLLQSGCSLNDACDVETFVRRLRAMPKSRVGLHKFLGGFESLTDTLARYDPTTIGDCVEVLLKKHEAKTYWGEKSLDSALAARPIKRQWPAAKFIQIVRDPRDVAFSYFEKKHGVKPTRELPLWRQLKVCGDFRKHGLRWDYWNRQIADAFAEMGGADALVVSYEDFVSNSDGELKRICRFLDLPYQKEMLSPAADVPELASHAWHRNIAKPVSSASVGQYALAPVVGGEIVAKTSAPSIETYNYVPDPVGPFVKVQASLFNLLAPVLPAPTVRRPNIVP